jgi:Family of unknown function (DUF5681)
MPRKLFQPGRSGNPRGRLPNGSTISDHLRDLLKRNYGEVELISKYLEQKGERKLGKVTAARLIACRLIIFSVNGSPEIVRQVLERTEGKVADRVDVNHRKTVNINIQLAGAPHNQLTEPEGELPEPRRGTALLEERTASSLQNAHNPPEIDGNKAE